MKKKEILRRLNLELQKGGFSAEEVESIIKASKDLLHLTKKVITDKNGHRRIVYVKSGEELEDTPVGGEIVPELNGMQIEQYSEKAILIKGDTYTNLDTLREIKQTIGVGSFNRKLNGWVFPNSFRETILGHIWSKLTNSGHEEKADAVQNQKNEGFISGENVNVQGFEGKVEKGVSDNFGIKYNITLSDGTKLEGVSENVLGKPAEKDDKKISEALNNASPENRIKIEKKLFGIQPVENIHQYSLQEYMQMHGLSDSDIQQAINSLKGSKSDSGDKKKRSSGGSSSSTKKTSTKDQKQGLTKKQLIGKLIYAHYQSVKSAIERGEKVPEKSLELYSDLKEQYSKKRAAMSEETKRKISEALKKNKNPKVKKSVEEADKSGVIPIDKENYKPKDGEDIEFSVPEEYYSNAGEKLYIKTKDYTDIPAIDIFIPKKNKTLNEPKPYFIPDINLVNFKKNSYILNAIKVDEDRYLIALDGFEKSLSNVASVKNINVSGKFAIMSLDAYVATENYYVNKAKEELKKENKENYEKLIKETKELIDKKVWDSVDISKEYNVENMSDNKKKEIENIYKDRLKNRLYEKLKTKPSRSRISVLSNNKMLRSQKHMIQLYYASTNNGKMPNDKEIWSIYKDLRKDFTQKSIDAQIQLEDLDGAFTKGRETSFGDKNTKDNLLNDYGVKIKRQNGDEIKESEISQIKGALDVVSVLFGNNKQMNKDFGLKISHSGNVNMHAMKAIGVFFPYYNAIGVSSKYGENKFQFTFGHEYSHFMDYWIGKKTGHNFASDKWGSTANKIASTFRKNMNGVKAGNKMSSYILNTKECFARSFEQYVAIETYGGDVEKIGKKYVDAEEQVDLETYKTKIKPLIKQFLEENKDILKSLFGDNLFTI